MTANQHTIKHVTIASTIMMASVFASRVIGVFREMTIAGIGGIHSGVDAYQIAFVLPEILNHIAASGFLTITFIPIFTRYLSANQKEDGNRIFSIIHNCFGTLLLISIVLSMIWTPQLVRMVAPGLPEGDTLALAVRMTRIVLPAQFFFFSGSLFMAVQFANKKFFIPALAPLIYNFSIILGGMILGPAIGMEGFAWGVLIGAFIGNFALQVAGGLKAGINYRLIFDFRHPDLKQYILLTLPLMMGLTMTFSIEFQFKFFGSFLAPGSIAALNYALRIMLILVGLFGQAVGQAAYPFLAGLAAKGEMDQLNDLLTRTLKMVFLVLPVSVLFIALRQEIVMILFQRGSFGAEATRITAGILPYFLFAAFAFSAQTIVNRGFYAQQNTLLPTLLTSACVIVFLWPSFVMMRHFGARGLALTLSISTIGQIFLLWECWCRRSGHKDRMDLYRFFGKTAFLAAVIAPVLVMTQKAVAPFSAHLGAGGAMITCTLIGVEFGLIFYLAGRILKITEIDSLFQTLSKRIFTWKKRSAGWQKK